MKLRLMSLTLGEEAIRTMVNKSRFGSSWRVYMHPIVALDGGWFLPAHDGSALRHIWMHRGSLTALLPKAYDDSVWGVWRELEGVVAAVPSAVIHNMRTNEAIMVNLVDDISDQDQLGIVLSASNALVKDMPTLYFSESQVRQNPEDVMMWLCRAFLDPGQSHLALVKGDHKVVVA